MNTYYVVEEWSGKRWYRSPHAKHFPSRAAAENHFKDHIVSICQYRTIEIHETEGPTFHAIIPPEATEVLKEVPDG